MGEVRTVPIEIWQPQVFYEWLIEQAKEDRLSESTIRAMKKILSLEQGLELKEIISSGKIMVYEFDDLLDALSDDDFKEFVDSIIIDKNISDDLEFEIDYNILKDKLKKNYGRISCRPQWGMWELIREMRSQYVKLQVYSSEIDPPVKMLYRKNASTFIHESIDKFFTYAEKILDLIIYFLHDFIKARHMANQSDQILEELKKMQMKNKFIWNEKMNYIYELAHYIYDIYEQNEWKNNDNSNRLKKFLLYLIEPNKKVVIDNKFIDCKEVNKDKRYIDCYGPMMQKFLLLKDLRNDTRHSTFGYNPREAFTIPPKYELTITKINDEFNELYNMVKDIDGFSICRILGFSINHYIMPELTLAISGGELISTRFTSLNKLNYLGEEDGIKENEGIFRVIEQYMSKGIELFLFPTKIYGNEYILNPILFKGTQLMSESGKTTVDLYVKHQERSD